MARRTGAAAAPKRMTLPVLRGTSWDGLTTIPKFQHRSWFPSHSQRLPQALGRVDQIREIALPFWNVDTLTAATSFSRCRVALKSGHPQFVCHGLTEFHRLKGSGRGIEEALGSNRQRGGW